MIIKEAVSSILWDKKKILILKRSQKVKTQKGKWAGVSGYLEGDIPLERAYIEIFEETTLTKDDLVLIKEGNYLDVPDSIKGKDIVWRIYPFLFYVNKPEKIVLDWEHDEMKWVKPDELNQYQTVPDFKSVIKRVLDF